MSDSLRTTIYYRTANARLELPYMDNDRHLAALGDSIRSLGADPAVVLRRILIQASASPDGNTKYNKELARKRGENLRDYLKDNLSARQHLSHSSRKERAGANWLKSLTYRCPLARQGNRHHP